MEKKVSAVEVAAEREELLRALRVLDCWYNERMDHLRELRADIQKGLRSGRITECRKEGTGKRYLTPRMIATLEVDQKLSLRSLLMMSVRKKQMDARLRELEKLMEEKSDTHVSDSDADSLEAEQEHDKSA